MTHCFSMFVDSDVQNGLPHTGRKINVYANPSARINPNIRFRALEIKLKFLLLGVVLCDTNKLVTRNPDFAVQSLNHYALLW